jgi:alpha-1,2-mannosyltransferase
VNEANKSILALPGRVLLYVITILLVAFYVVTIVAIVASHPVGTDFAKFYKSVEFFWEGKNIYTPVPVDAFGPLPASIDLPRDSLHANLNPPFQTLLFAPFGLLSYKLALTLWLILSLALGVAGVVLLRAGISGAAKPALPLFAALLPLLLYYPTWINMLYAQYGLVLLFLIALVWRTSRTGGEQVAGIALGLALSLKLFMGLFLIFFIVRRQWRLLFWAGCTYLACGLMALVVAGSDSYLHYLQAINEVSWYSTDMNASLKGFFVRLFGGDPDGISLLLVPGAADTVSAIMSLILMLALVWIAWPRSREGSTTRSDIGFCFTAVAMLLISPLGWLYYFPILLLPLLILWHTAGRSVLYRGTAGFAWILTTLPLHALPIREGEIATVFGWGALSFYALLLLAAGLGGVARALEDGTAEGITLYLPTFTRPQRGSVAE